MTNAEASKGLEKLIKFYEDNQQHLLLGAARQLYDDANKADPEAEANMAIAHFVEQLGSPEMMKKMGRDEEAKNEDSCDWTINGSNNNFYSMRDIPTSESAKSNFRTLCEAEMSNIKNDGRNERLVKAVAASCNCSEDEAWDEILGARQQMECNIACDPDRAHEYLQWALEDLGLELDYAEEFITDVPYKEVEPESDEDEELDLDL